MIWHFSIYWVLFSGGWYFINGALHDFFIIRNHKGAYDRELLRLLMDGHVLMLSGAILFVDYIMMLNHISEGAWIGVIISLGMLIYCGMIFPFLKSIATIMISILLFVASLYFYLHP